MGAGEGEGAAMTDCDWFDEYERDARQSGDADRCRLGLLHRQAYHFRETDPDQALALLDDGRRLAVALREPWWALYYDQQRAHALLHFKQDYRDVLELAVRNTLELRKPGFAAFPRRLLIHGDLVSAYLGIDPVGHAEQIRQALGYLDGQVPEAGDERYLLLGSQRQFALELDRLDEALALSHDSLALAAADPSRERARHFLVFAYSGLAEIAWRRGDFGLLGEVAGLGEEHAAQVGHQVERAGFHLWQALCLHRDGRPAAAKDLHRKAVARLGRMGMPPDSSYRDAECALYEMAGDLDQALAVRDAEIASIRDRGRLVYEAACQVKRAWLRRRLGALTTDDVRVAREAAARLRQPAGPLAQIDRIERGEAP